MEHAIACSGSRTGGRFQSLLADLLERLPAWPGRFVTDAERTALDQSEHLGVFLRLAAAPSAEREKLLHEAEPGKLALGRGGLAFLMDHRQVGGIGLRGRIRRARQQ
jgi:hypothetical protein